MHLFHEIRYGSPISSYIVPPFPDSSHSQLGTLVNFSVRGGSKWGRFLVLRVRVSDESTPKFGD